MRRLWEIFIFVAGIGIILAVARGFPMLGKVLLFIILNPIGIAALVGIITATAMWLSPRPDLAAMAPWTLIAGLGLLGALFVGLSLRGFRPLHRSPQPWPARSAPWLLALGVPLLPQRVDLVPGSVRGSAARPGRSWRPW